MRRSMRGRKLDSDFMSEYIYKCAISGPISLEEVCNIARQELKSIDAKILEVEGLKSKRTKINDMIYAIEKNKAPKDNLIFNLFKLKNPRLSFLIAKQISEDGTKISSINFYGEDKREGIFCIKDMCKNNIIKYQSGLYYRSLAYSDIVGVAENIFFA